MGEIRCQHGVRMTETCVECGRHKASKVSLIDKGLPAVLLKQRTALRAMMQHRCAQKGSPIPLAMANRVADWILMMVAFRANERRKLGKEAFPDQETLTDDISRSAEAIEIVFTVAIEEVTEIPTIMVAGGPVLEAANDERAYPS
jgi:hypothetical protein